MFGNMVIQEMFKEFHINMLSDEEFREELTELCSETSAISGKIFCALQAIHHSKECVAPACQKARELFVEARESYQKIKEFIPKSEYYKYHEYWRKLTQRFCFLITLTVWLEEGTLARPEICAEILGIEPTAVKDGIHLDINDYLCGVTTLVAELVRLAVNSVPNEDIECVKKIYLFVSEINAGFKLFQLENGRLRKRIEALKEDMDTIEEIMYSVGLGYSKPGNEDTYSCLDPID